MLQESNADCFDCAVCGSANADVKFLGVRSCGHRLCGVCAVKLAVFARDQGSEYDYSCCVICKQPGTKVIISASPKPFESFVEKDMMHIEKYDLLLDGVKAHLFYKDIVKIECKKCHHQFVSIDDLVDHIEIHNLRYCNLCVQFNKCLPSEFIPMTDNDFHYHNTKEHPKCKFCNKRFYDNAHLIKHAKESHFLCDICNRNQGFVAYSTQEELLKHFSNDHFMCDICRTCNNINVFDSEYNLKTHKVLEHDNKGLVSEGLVNVSYGDSSSRFGPRRRARDQGDTITASSTAIDQDLPEISCEEAFPPLNGEQPTSINKQLGAMSVTNDDNDARRAFRRTEEMDGKGKKDVQSKEGVPGRGGVVYSAKRTMGSLNDSDFPSLSGQGTTSSTINNHTVEYGRVKNGPQSNKTASSGLQRRIQGEEEEYPALNMRGGPPLTKNPTWNHTNKAPALPRDAGLRMAPKVTARARDPSPPEVNMDVEREVASKPKIQVVTREDFEQTCVKSEVTPRQRLPQEDDFPTLGKPKNNEGPAVNNSGWGPVNTCRGERPVPKDLRGSTTTTRDVFAANDPLDFPELSFKSKPASAAANVNQKQKGKSKKKENFADVASGNGSVPKSKVFSLKSIGEQFQRPTPSPTVQPDRDFEAPRQVTSSSIRGLDYVPHVVPTKDSVVLVDSKKFCEMKASAKVGGKQEGGFSLSKEADDIVPSNNHFDILLNSVQMPTNESKTKSGSSQTKFKTSSHSDFPDLPMRSTPLDKGRPISKAPLRKTDKFVDVAAVPSEGGTKVYSLKSPGDQKPELCTLDPVSEEVRSFYPPPQPSCSMRGVDYVPYVEPRNENVTLVDAKKFSQLKQGEPSAHDGGRGGEDFSSHGASEFPGLPVKPRPSTTQSKSKLKSQDRDNFASKAVTVSKPSSDHVSRPVSDHVSRPVSDHVSRPVAPRPDLEVVPEVSVVPSASLRGVDYIPCVEPRNESVVLVDSKVFQDLKVSDDTQSTVSTDKVEKTLVMKVVPKLSSEADFRVLLNKRTEVGLIAPEVPKMKKKEESGRLKEVLQPVVSLTDVAMTVTKKMYVPFVDTDDRNQRLFDLVNSTFKSPELATAFLRLSGQYRNRKISVQDYLDRVCDTFEEHSSASFMGHLLPQMLVLLPDISLQKSLLTHMPHEWSLALKECPNCGQIINVSDTEDHQVVAHG